MTYDKLLQKADQAYKTLRDLDKWGPAVHNRDRTSAPESLVNPETNVLDQRNGNGNNRRNNNNNKGTNSSTTKKDGSTFVRKCHRCQSTDHLIADCPKKENWKNKAPRSGAPQSKSVDGQEFHWCAKCAGGKGRWTTSHGTADHVAGKGKANNKISESNVHEGLYCQWTDGDWIPETNVHCHHCLGDGHTIPTTKSSYEWYMNILFFFTFELPRMCQHFFHQLYEQIQYSFGYWSYMMGEILMVLFYGIKLFLRMYYNEWKYQRGVFRRKNKSRFLYDKRHRKYMYQPIRLLSFPRAWCIFSCLQVDNYNVHGFLNGRFTSYGNKGGLVWKKRVNGISSKSIPVKGSVDLSSFSSPVSSWKDLNCIMYVKG